MSVITKANLKKSIFCCCLVNLVTSPSVCAGYASIASRIFHVERAKSGDGLAVSSIGGRIQGGVVPKRLRR